jgi:Rrf2 family protein
MFDLAMHYGEGPVPLVDILKRQEISLDYIRHLFLELKKVGLVKSERGPNGGYSLARKPSEIKVGEIIRAVEGPLAPVDCVIDIRKCHRVDGCITRLLWKKLGEKITEFLDSITLEDLCREAKSLWKDLGVKEWTGHLKAVK